MNTALKYGPDWQEYGSYESSIPAYRLSQPSAPPALSMAPAAVAAAPAAGTPSAPNPWIAGAGLALGGAGTLLSAYGAYKQSQAMDEQNDLAARSFDLQKQLAFQDRAKAEEERQRQAALQGGQYAMGADDRLYGRYGEYSRRTGA